MSENAATTKPMRALIGHDVRGALTVLATDSQQIAFDCDELSSCCEDIGLASINSCPERGLWLWEGTARVENVAGYFDPPEYGTVYDGTFRRVEPSEVAALYAMQWPEPADGFDEPPTNEFCIECGASGGCDRYCA